MIEKERKFLINDKVNIEKYKLKSKLIKQGYLLLGQGGRQLRIRILDKKAYVCYKYKISEYEKAESNVSNVQIQAFEPESESHKGERSVHPCLT